MPERKSGSNVSLGIGGSLFGGGGHSGHEGHDSHGAGISIPLGGGPDPKAEGTPLYLPDGPIVIVAELSIGGTNTVSATTPYCRDSAGQGIRIGFTVPDGPPVPIAFEVGYSTHD